MLYQDKPLGRASLAARFAAGLAALVTRRRYADLDLRGMNPYLRRDLGIGEFMGGDTWRK